MVSALGGGGQETKVEWFKYGTAVSQKVMPLNTLDFNDGAKWEQMPIKLALK